MKELKYLTDGNIVRVMSALPDGRILVEMGHAYPDDEGDDGEVFFGGSHIVSATDLHDKPVVDKIAKDIRDLEQQKKETNEQLIELRRQVTLTERRIEQLKVYAPLKRIEDFLAGKITHAVIWESYGDIPTPIIKTLEELRSTEGSERAASKWDPIKLMALFGRADKSLEWKLNRYADGSGSWDMCQPFCSLEEATAFAHEMLRSSFPKYVFPVGASLYKARELLKSAKACGFPLPPDFERQIREHELAGFDAEIAKHERERQSWQERRAAFEASN